MSLLGLMILTSTTTHVNDDSSDGDASLTDDDDTDSVESGPEIVPGPPTPVPLRRLPNPNRLNNQWQALFRDALAPPRPDQDFQATPRPALPPPLRTAPNDPVGHTFRQKSLDSFRIWSANVNGLSAKDNFAALHDLRATLKIRGVDCIAIQEPNLDFLQAKIRDKIKTVCCQHFGVARLVTSTTCIKAPTSWKPGGRMLIVLGHWANAVV
jgi:hypothetical protein